MPKQYEWDIFLSYPRGGAAEEWVHNHFRRRLQHALEDILPHAPRIFVDSSMPPGTVWPDSLKRNLKCSKILVAIWSPPYFYSPWCVAEWHSMRERATRCGIDSCCLVFPIEFSGRDVFPEDARNTQQFKMEPWNCPARVFEDSVSYIDFLGQIKLVAHGIKTMLPHIPVFSEGWPIVDPDVPEEPNDGVPHI